MDAERIRGKGMVKSQALRNARYLVAALYVIQTLLIYVFWNDHAASYEIFCDYIGRSDLPLILDCTYVIIAIMVGLWITAILLITKNKLAPFASVVVSAALIAVRENPYIFEGTKYDKPEVVSGKTVQMWKLVLLSLVTFTIWLDNKPQENVKENVKED